MMKRIGLGILVAVALLAGVLAWNAFHFTAATDQGDKTTLASAPAFDAQALAQSLAEAVRLPTVSYDQGAAPADLARSEAALNAFETFVRTRFPHAIAAMNVEKIGAHTLLLQWRGADAALPAALFMAHQDVVPVAAETLKEWTHPAFEGAIADGFVWGRGTLDDKSTLVTLMAAADALAGAGYRPNRTVDFLFGHDEEIGGTNGAALAIAAMKARGDKIQFALDEGMAVLDPFPITGKRTALIGVAEKGSVNILLVAKGAGGHSSLPPRNSPSVRLARAIVALDQHQMPGGADDAPVGLMMRAVSPDLPFMTRLALANPWAFGGLIDAQFAKIPAANASVRTTTAPTMLSGSPKSNVLPQEARAVVNFRIHPRDNPDSVLAHVRKVIGTIAGVSAAFADETPNSASPISPTDTDSYRLLAAAARLAGEGARVAPALVVAGTDSRRAYALTNEVYRFTPYWLGPDDLARLHGVNERIAVRDLGRMADVFARLIKSAGGEGAPAAAATR